MAKLLDENALRAVKTCLDLKVDKISGKGLSTNDFTNTYKNVLDNTVIDVTNGVSQAIKDKVSANPATVLKYGDYYYVPQYQPEEGTIPTFYNCFEGDESTFRWLEISWVNMNIESSSKSFLDGSSSDFVHISTVETISGAKTFSANNGIVISGNSQTAKLHNGSPATTSGFIIELGAGSGGQVQLFQKSWSPTVDGAQSSGTADLGRSALRWKNLYLSNNLSDGTNSTTVSNIVSKLAVANPTLTGTESSLNSLQVGNTKYRIFVDSGIINLGTMYYGYDNEQSHYYAYFDHAISGAEDASIPSTGIAIIMFNTTCVCIPYTRNQENRFVCNAICDNDGVSIVAKARLTFSETIQIYFDYNYAQTVTHNMMNKPYCIIRFIGL